MRTQNEPNVNGEFLVSRPKFDSISTGTLAQRDDPYLDGTLLMASGGEFVEFDASGPLVGILKGPIYAHAGPVKAVMVVGRVEVDSTKLVIPAGLEGSVRDGLALLQIEAVPPIEGEDDTELELTEDPTEAPTEEATEEETETGTF